MFHSTLKIILSLSLFVFVSMYKNQIGYAEQGIDQIIEKTKYERIAAQNKRVQDEQPQPSEEPVENIKTRVFLRYLCCIIIFNTIDY